MKRTVYLMVLLLLIGINSVKAQQHNTSRVIAVSKMGVHIGHTQDTATVDEILALPGLVPGNKDCLVVSYDLAISVDGNKDVLGPENIKGSWFPTGIKKQLQALRNNTGVIYIDNVKLKCKGNAAATYPARLFFHP